jgi:hypothetical protein
LTAGLGGTTATFSITDGALGDDNLAADGQVIDAGGPGVGPGALTAVPLGDGLPWLIALALAAATAWRRYRTGVPLGFGKIAQKA